MGFTTGFIGGFTLTASVLYLSVALHARNRAHQSALLRQQFMLLTNIVEPMAQPDIPPAREMKTDLWESTKDRWNNEVAGAVRRIQTTDWPAVRERFEKDVGALWQKIREAGSS